MKLKLEDKIKIIKFYEKESNLSYSSIKEINKDVIYTFVNKFMNKNNISIRDFINLCFPIFK